MEFIVWVIRPIIIAALIGGGINYLLDSVEVASQHMVGALTVNVED